MLNKQLCIQKICAITVIFFLVVHGARNSPKNSTPKSTVKSCTLPEHPINGLWSISGSTSQHKPGEKVKSGTSISTGCSDQYTLIGQSLITCKNGKWSSKIGECLKLCPPIITTPSTLVNCTFEGKTVKDCKIAKDGTIATFQCAPFYENPELNRNPFRVCRDGSWSKEIPSCTPICGIKPKPPSDTARSYYPWNVAIFKVREQQVNFQCGGTLINERVVLTAAHCVTDNDGNKMPVNIYKVAAGKSSEEYTDSRDTEVQYSDVEDIFIVNGFKGSTRKYQNNFAVIIAKTAFNMTRRIQPVCFDWNNKYSEIFKYPGTKGYVPGPLKKIFFSNIKEVFEIDVPFVNDSQCYSLLTSQTQRANFEAFYTHEKICAGYVNSTKSPMCLLDDAVGLVSKNEYDNKWYITAVVAGKNAVFYRTSCDGQRWVLFAQVSKYLDFIKEKNDLYTTIKRPYFQTSCGTKSVQAKPLVINGKNVTKGDYPWQVALYRFSETTKELICGGSLINQRVILTAAHCVTDLQGNAFPKQFYIVAVGKYYRDFDDTRDTNVQFSTLKDIFVPKQYKGDIQNYIADIAILVTENSFILNKYVEPVCVDWDTKYESQFLRPSAKGFVTGWGLTKENSNPSEVLKELEVPYVETDQCREKLHETTDYENYLTADKMCSGYLNKGASVCSGDSGGGLVFKNINDAKYYIAGIVSISPQSPTGGCDSQHYALYTKVSQYITNFVLEKVRLYWF